MKSIGLLAILLLIIYPTVNTYSPSLALQLGHFSGAAYESAASIEAWNCSYCRKYNLTDVKVFSSSLAGVQGFTGFSHTLNAVIVAFRGSSNIQNWILNIDGVRNSYSLCTGCSVHNGFYSSYVLVASAVKTAVQNLKAKYRNTKLMVTGHSLGGAMAILCAADLKNLFGNVDSTYTFGQPRVGNPAFASWFQSTHPNTFRLVDYADIVPHLPPSNLGFVHSNTQAWYQRGMQSYQLCQPESPTCANSVTTSNFSTDDHSLDNYLKLKVGGPISQFLQKLEQGAFYLLNKNLRQDEQFESQEWKDKQLEKINEIRAIFGKEKL